MDASGKIGSAETEAWSRGEEDRGGDGRDDKGGVSAPVVVAGMSWWMLLMTAAYFHTWFEKVGLLPLKSKLTWLTVNSSQASSWLSSALLPCTFSRALCHP